jgi:class 3 adenylate cyclase
MSQIRYVTTTDGVRLGYDVQGSGPPLLFVRGWISDLEEMASSPRLSAYFSALADRFTVIRYDARTQGVSDNDIDHVDLDAFVLDVEAILEILELDDVILYGQCFGGPIAISYAASHPYRVSKLILDGTYATPPKMSEQELEAFLKTIERLWPQSASLLAGLTTPQPEDSAGTIIPHDRFHRLPGKRVAMLYRAASRFLVADLLSSIHVPVLVMHRRRSRSIPIDLGRDLAAGLADVRFVPLEGSAHNPWDGDAQAALDAIGDFLGAELRLPRRASGPATPVAILFTDMAESTALTSKLGDVGGHELVRTHDAVVRAAIAENAGAEVKHTGDGIMASFPSISAALACAIDIQKGLRVAEAPFQVRIGIDAGEPLVQDGDLTGVVVQSARRIVDKASPGQILASDVVRKLVAGKTFHFTDRGRHVLKGIPERARLFEVEWSGRRDGPTAPPAEGDVP